MQFNGKSFKLTTTVTLLKFLQQQNFYPERVAVELNGAIICRSVFATLLLTNNDHLEIVQFVGGG